jgi:hypothetical protein
MSVKKTRVRPARVRPAQALQQRWSLAQGTTGAEASNFEELQRLRILYDLVLAFASDAQHVCWQLCLYHQAHHLPMGMCCACWANLSTL